jgi:hypothetical protein
MSELPTVKVKRDGPRGWRIINASNFDPAVHQHWDEGEAITAALAAPPLPEPPASAMAALSAFNGADPAKFDHDGKDGPGGSSPSPDPGPGDPPANWRGLHWTKRVKLAKEHGAAEDIDAKGADAFLEALEH